MQRQMATGGARHLQVLVPTSIVTDKRCCLRPPTRPACSLHHLCAAGYATYIRMHCPSQLHDGITCMEASACASLQLASAAQPIQAGLLTHACWAVLVLASASSAPGAAPPIASITASAVNQDGRSSGLTAPNGPSQSSLIREALQAAHMAGPDLAFVAVHGTGTPLGDPIEVGGLGGALKGRDGAVREQHRPVMGSVKACFGHTEGAAGVTGQPCSSSAGQHLCQAHIDAPHISLRAKRAWQVVRYTSHLVVCGVLCHHGKPDAVLAELLHSHQAKPMLTCGTMPCAGVFMMLHAMTQRSHAAIMPLRSLNPYVSTALAEWARTPGLRPAVPRQTAPASQWEPRAAAGTSSFGMSGTNAHMLAAVAQPCQAVQAEHAWQRSRYCSCVTHLCEACSMQSMDLLGPVHACSLLLLLLEMERCLRQE